MKCVFEGMGAVEKGVSVLLALRQVKRGFEVWGMCLALGEMCFEGMGAVEKGV